VYGFCISANYSLTSPILVELVSLEKFSTAYGFLLAAQVSHDGNSALIQFMIESVL
jgi:hypothetical protein